MFKSLVQSGLLTHFGCDCNWTGLWNPKNSCNCNWTIVDQLRMVAHMVATSLQLVFHMTSPRLVENWSGLVVTLILQVSILSFLLYTCCLLTSTYCFVACVTHSHIDHTHKCCLVVSVFVLHCLHLSILISLCCSHHSLTHSPPPWTHLIEAAQTVVQRRQWQQCTAIHPNPITTHHPHHNMPLWQCSHGGMQVSTYPHPTISIIDNVCTTHPGQHHHYPPPTSPHHQRHNNDNNDMTTTPGTTTTQQQPSYWQQRQHGDNDNMHNDDEVMCAANAAMKPSLMTRWWWQWWVGRGWGGLQQWGDNNNGRGGDNNGRGRGGQRRHNNPTWR